MLKIKKFVFNPFNANTYIVYDKIDKVGFIIDACNYSEIENKTLADFIFSNELSIDSILLTHAHIDHILGLDFLYNNFSKNIYLNYKDLRIFESVIQYADMFDIQIQKLPKPNYDLSILQSIPNKTLDCKIIPIPGHSPGGSAFLFEKSGYLFTGDSLFLETIGRTDLPGGNYDDLIYSLKNRILILPKDIQVFPGHGEKTDISHEMEYNSFLNQ